MTPENSAGWAKTQAICTWSVCCECENDEIPGNAVDIIATALLTARNQAIEDCANLFRTSKINGPYDLDSLYIADQIRALKGK